MCEATTVWRKSGGFEEKHPCSQGGELCSYHQKMRDGLLTPLIPEGTDPKINVPVRVEYKGGVLWTL